MLSAHSHRDLSLSRSLKMLRDGESWNGGMLEHWNVGNTGRLQPLLVQTRFSSTRSITHGPDQTELFHTESQRRWMHFKHCGCALGPVDAPSGGFQCQENMFAVGLGQG